MTARDRLHRLVDALPESERETAARVLEVLGHLDVDRRRHTIEAAPVDDEPETPDERAAVEEARAELARGEGIPAHGEGIPAHVVYRAYGV